MKIKFMLAAVAGLVGWQTFADGEKVTLTVASGQTETFAAALSAYNASAGTSYAVADFAGGGQATTLIEKSGPGTLTLDVSLAGHTGGFSLSGGVVDVTVGEGLGDGTVTFASKSAKVTFDAEGVTFANKFVMSVSGDLSTEQMLVMKGMTLTGEIDSTDKNIYIRHNPANTGNDNGTGPTATYTGAITASTLMFGTYGTAVLKGKVTAAKLRGNGVWSAGGTVELWNPENEIGTLECSKEVYLCQGKNVAKGASRTWSTYWTGDSNTKRGALNLNGKDQELSYLSHTKSNLSRPLADRTSVMVVSDADATLTLTGAAEDAITYDRIDGKVTVVLDSRENMSFRQTFRRRYSNTTGALVVSNGTLAVEEDATFRNVTSVRLANASALDISTLGVSPFAEGAVDLDLSEGCSLYLPTAFPVSIKRLSVNGVPQSGRLYDGSTLPQIKSGSIRILSEETLSANWNGSGSIREPSNWEGGATPDLYSGALVPFFAVCGSSATVDAPGMMFAGIRFNAEDGFTLASDETAAAFSLFEKGITIESEPDDPVRNYAIEAPLRVLADQVWTVPSNQTLKVRSAEISPGASLSVGGRGQLEVSGEWMVVGSVVVTAASVRVTGTIATPDHVNQGVAVKNGLSTLTFNGAPGSDAQQKEQPTLVMAGGRVEKPVYGHGYMGKEIIVAEEATTNVLAGNVKFETPWIYLTSQANALMTFSSGLGSSWSVRQKGTGDIRIVDEPLVVEASTGYNIETGTLRLDATNCSFTALTTGYYNGKNYAPQIVFERSHALKHGVLGNGVFLSNSRLAAMTSGRPVIDLGGTVQTVDELMGSTIAVFRSERPARIEVVNQRILGDSYLPTVGFSVASSIEGPVTLAQCGAGTLLLKSQAFASFGDLEVTNGVLELAADASWLNGTNVVVAGTGVLKVGQSKTFGRQAALRVADQGKLWLAEGVDLRIPSAVLVDENGHETSLAGEYSADNPGPLAGHFADGSRGSVKLGRFGLMLVVR